MHYANWTKKQLEARKELLQASQQAGNDSSLIPIEIKLINYYLKIDHSK